MEVESRIVSIRGWEGADEERPVGEVGWQRWVSSGVLQHYRVNTVNCNLLYIFKKQKRAFEYSQHREMINVCGDQVTLILSLCCIYVSKYHSVSCRYNYFKTKKKMFLKTIKSLVYIPAFPLINYKTLGKWHRGFIFQNVEIRSSSSSPGAMRIKHDGNL